MLEGTIGIGSLVLDVPNYKTTDYQKNEFQVKYQIDKSGELTINVFVVQTQETFTTVILPETLVPPPLSSFFFRHVFLLFLTYVIISSIHSLLLSCLREVR